MAAMIKYFALLFSSNTETFKTLVVGTITVVLKSGDSLNDIKVREGEKRTKHKIWRLQMQMITYPARGFMT